MCVAYSTTGFANCLKEKCPGNWECKHKTPITKCHANRANFKAFLDAKIKTCTGLLKVDLSGSTTYTGVTVPTNMSNVNVTFPPNAMKEGGLSMSDKIALGIGIGFGIPTVIIGVGTLVCVRRRKARAARGLPGSWKI